MRRFAQGIFAHTISLLRGLAVAALLAGCGGAASLPTPSPAPEWIELQRSGGFAGLADSLRVNLSSGEAILTRGDEGRELRLDQATLSSVRSAVAGADFAQLDPEAMPDDPCCDYLEYRVRYGAYTVHTTDASMPAALGPVVAALEGVIVLLDGGGS